MTRKYRVMRDNGEWSPFIDAADAQAAIKQFKIMTGTSWPRLFRVEGKYYIMNCSGDSIFLWED